MAFQSLWADTVPASPAFGPLGESLSCDVLVIGGGFQGLSAALHLAEAGTDVVLIEAHEPGFGASGRNGGQVIPGLKDDPDTLDRLWGPEATAFAGSTADTLFALVARLGIDCDAEQGGWVQAGNRRVHLPALEARMRQWQARGVAADWLDSTAMAQVTGANGFLGGWRDPRAGRVHPLKLARGLARAAHAAGVRIFTQTPLSGLARCGAGWHARLPSGAQITAEQVILASNVYTTTVLDPRLRRATVPANSFQVATAPLSSEQLARFLPGGEVVSEVRRVGTYFRIGPEGRIMLGGRGSFADPQGPEAFAKIAAELTRLFGERFEITHRWFGRVGMTPDHRIRLCKPAPGLLAATGFNGRGVALSVSLGKAMAAHLANGKQLPIPPSPTIPNLPFHALHRIYGGLGIQYYRLRDALDR